MAGRENGDGNEVNEGKQNQIQFSGSEVNVGEVVCFRILFGKLP